MTEKGDFLDESSKSSGNTSFESAEDGFCTNLQNFNDLIISSSSLRDLLDDWRNFYFLQTVFSSGNEQVLNDLEGTRLQLMQRETLFTEKLESILIENEKMKNEVQRQAKKNAKYFEEIVILREKTQDYDNLSLHISCLVSQANFSKGEIEKNRELKSENESFRKLISEKNEIIAALEEKLNNWEISSFTQQNKPAATSSGSKNKPSPRAVTERDDSENQLKPSKNNPFLNMKTYELKPNNQGNFWIDDLQQELDEKDQQIDKLEDLNENLSKRVKELSHSLRKAQILAEKLRQGSAGAKIEN